MGRSTAHTWTAALVTTLALAAAAAAQLPQNNRKSPWLNYYPQATALAKKQDKLILVYFRGSDWSEWCRKLEQDVLETPYFLDWAKKNVLLLEIDFPSKARQAPAIAKQNRELKEKYNISKVPTFVFLNAEGQPIARFDYEAAHLREEEPKGLPRAWVATCQKVVDHPPEPEKLQTLEGFLPSRDYAKEHGVPVLMILQKGQDVFGDEKVARLLASPQFQKFAQISVAVTRVRWPDAADTSDEAKAFDAWRQKHNVIEVPMQLILWDVEKDNLTDRIFVFRPDSLSPLIRRLESNLPPIVYNGEWITDVRKAKAISAQTRRTVMLAFVAKDWDPFTKKLYDEIFSSDDFKEYSRRHMVLVELDFPKAKPLPPRLKKQNETLADTYQVRGFPTMVLLNAAGQKIATAGYQKGGAFPLLEEVDRIRKEDLARKDHPSLW